MISGGRRRYVYISLLSCLVRPPDDHRQHHHHQYRASLLTCVPLTFQHCEQLSKLPGFVRTTRYKAKHAWWSVGGGATLPCPDWFEIIEFDHPDVDILTIVEHPDSSEEGQEVLEELLASLSFEFGGFCVEKTWGRDFMFKPTFALKS